MTVTLAFIAATVMFATSGFLSASASDEPAAASDKPAAAPEEPLTPAQKEVFAVIEEYNQALGRKDVDACMAVFVPGPDTMVMGTGPGETWRGPEEIRDAHVNFFKGFDKETTEPVWRHVHVLGDVAWVAAQSYHVDHLKGEKREFIMNVSGVFQKMDGKWRIAMIHASNVTGGKQK
jgi:uncharacterized protein (TIGR02246 family)